MVFSAQAGVELQKHKGGGVSKFYIFHSALKLNKDGGVVKNRGAHWNQKVVILATFSSLAALEVVIRTTSGATSDEKVVSMTTFCFQCLTNFTDGVPVLKK